MLTKFAKVFIIVCMAAVVLVPWMFPGRRHGREVGDSGSDGASTTGHGGGDGGNSH